MSVGFLSIYLLRPELEFKVYDDTSTNKYLSQEKNIIEIGSYIFEKKGLKKNLKPIYV